MAKKATFPKNNGKDISWRLFKSLPKVTASLTEGVTPAGTKATIVEFKAKLAQEGDFIEFSDLIQLEGVDPVVTEFTDLLGEQAGQRVEDLIVSTISSGTNVYYAKGAANAAAVQTAKSKISLADIDNIMRTLKRRNAKKIDGKYIAEISPEVEMDLKGLDTNGSWVDVNKYAKPETILEGEIGTFRGFKWIVSNNLLVDETSTSVHKCLFYGADAYGVVELDGAKANNVEIIYKPLGSGNDPLNQRQSLGWKINGFVARILHEEALVRYEVYTDATEVKDLTDANRKHYSAANTGA